MAVIVPTEFEVTPKSELVTARIEPQPLERVLRGLNYLYRHHTPPLVDVVLTGEADTTRDQAFEFVITPSADSMAYRVVTRWRQEAAGNTQVVVKEFRASTGAYHTIGAHASTAYGGGEQSVTERCTIDRTASRLRIEFVASAAYMPQHVMAYPEPLVWPATTVSGFSAYNDGLWAATGAPCHTQLINRCKSDAMAILRDRRQCVLSFCQEHSTSPLFDGKYNTSVSSFGTTSMSLGVAVCSLPGQSKTVVDLSVIGYTSAVSPGQGYRVRVAQLGGGPGSAVTFVLSNTFDNPATGNNEAQTLPITLYGEAPRVEIVAQTGDATGLYTCVINSVIGLWRPGD
jgi:hypothetical protein